MTGQNCGNCASREEFFPCLYRCARGKTDAHWTEVEAAEAKPCAAWSQITPIQLVEQRRNRTHVVLAPISLRVRGILKRVAEAFGFTVEKLRSPGVRGSKQPEARLHVAARVLAMHRLSRAELQVYEIQAAMGFRFASSVRCYLKPSALEHARKILDAAPEKANGKPVEP